MSETERELVYEDDSRRLYWDAGVRCVELEVKQYTSIGDNRAAMERVLQLIEGKNATKLLADTANMGKVDDEELTWMETDWLPRILEAGVKFIAVVPPKALASHMVLDQMVTRVDPGATGHVRRFFHSAEEAREWLKQQ